MNTKECIKFLLDQGYRITHGLKNKNEEWVETKTLMKFNSKDLESDIDEFISLIEDPKNMMWKLEDAEKILREKLNLKYIDRDDHWEELQKIRKNE